MVWFDGDYGYKKKITIDNTKVAGNETNFPILISVTDEDLADTGNGGHVQNANGYDIIFTNNDEDTQLKHEIERYINTDGTLVFWVKVDSLSGGVNTDIYIYYGKAGVGADPSSTDTWDANFVGVYHMGDTAGNCHDSTGNSHDATFGGDLPTRIEGKIGWAQDFDGTGDFINLPAGCHVPATGTYELQLKAGSTPNHVRMIEAGDEAGFRHHFDMRGDVTRHDINWKYEGQEWVDADPTDPDTNDHYYAFSFVSGNLDWFRDNVNMGSSGIATANFDYDNFYIGCSGGTAVFFDGELSELRISNIKRSDNWLLTTYNTQTSPGTFMSWGEEETEGPPANNPPDAPITPDPTDDEEDIGINPDLSVYVEDADADAMDVRFYNADGDVLIDTALAVASGTRAQVTWADLEYATVYEWYAIADDGEDTTQSDTWQFTTEDAPPNAPPDAPSAPDPAHEETGVEIDLTLSALVGDDDGEDMDVTFYDASDDSVIDVDLSVPDGERASAAWNNLEYSTEYSWYAIADDGIDTTSSPTWTFTTKAQPAPSGCETFTITGILAVTLVQPFWGGGDNSISKKIDRTSFHSGNYVIDDDGINTQPLVLRGVETNDSIVTLTAQMVKLLDMADNNEEVTISGLGENLDGVYVIKQFGCSTVKGAIKAYAWRITLEKVG